MVICCSIILFFSKLIAHILYLKDFYGAWLYTPFLMISVVFGALSGWLGGIYSAVKNSKIIGRTTIIGAIINIIFNFILVYFIGIMGAAISTALSYFIVWLVRFINLKKYIKLKVNVKTDFAVYLLLIFQCISIILIQNELILYSTQILFIILILCFYRNIIKKIIMWRKSYE